MEGVCIVWRAEWAHVANQNQLIRLHGGVCRGVSLQLIALCGGLWWAHVANQNHPRMHGGCMEGVWRGVTPIN